MRSTDKQSRRPPPGFHPVAAAALLLLSSAAGCRDLDRDAGVRIARRHGPPAALAMDETRLLGDQSAPPAGPPASASGQRAQAFLDDAALRGLEEHYRPASGEWAVRDADEDAARRVFDLRPSTEPGTILIQLKPLR